MKHYSPQLLMTLKLYSHYRKDKSMKTFNHDNEDENAHKQYTKSPQKRIAKITLFKPDFDQPYIRNSLINGPARYSDKINFYVEIGFPTVRQILKQRIFLNEIPNMDYATVVWKATSFGLQFQAFNKRKHKQIVNHFEFHSEMTNKTKLYMNLKQFGFQNGVDIDSFVPFTFIINGQNLKVDLEKFYEIFEQSNYKIYLFKPPDRNRGQGIQLFNDLSTLKKLIKEYVTTKSTQKSKQISVIFQIKIIDQESLIWKDIIQLHQQISLEQWQYGGVLNKFSQYFKDWERQLSRNILRICFYQMEENSILEFGEGYLRLSSENYTKKSLTNLYIHLTNNAIQKNHPYYGRKEDGNQLGFGDLQRYLSERLNKPQIMQQSIIPQIKDIIKLVLKSIEKKLDPYRRQYCYELFGFDFILDDKLMIHLIEVNTNPCLELSSNLLKKLIPRMLNDTFRLTVDKVFNTGSQIHDVSTEYSIPGYKDQDNLWYDKEYLTKVN